MDEIFQPPFGRPLEEKERLEHLDPFLARRVEARPWELRAAQWRAWALAEMAFEGDVHVSLVGRPGHESFRGLLYFTVPFKDLADHQDREGLFMSWVREDPILTRVPLVFIFEPNPLPVP